MSSDRFEDERGVIQDLLSGPIDSVTEITTCKGAIRGNHTHRHTIQWTYIVSGRLLVASERDVVHTQEYETGDMITELNQVAHAWQALEDTRVLVFTRGPRSGASYESDTVRLEVPLLGEG